MGKGDKKTRRGKIIMKSTGVTRPRKRKKASKVSASDSGRLAIKDTETPLVTEISAAPVSALETPEMASVEGTGKPATKKKAAVPKKPTVKKTVTNKKTAAPSTSAKKKTAVVPPEKPEKTQD